jgi:hypothetical protein
MNTPDTLNYLFLGMGAIAFLTLGYVVTLVLRHQDLKKTRALVEQLAEEEER